MLVPVRGLVTVRVRVHAAANELIGRKVYSCRLTGLSRVETGGGSGAHGGKACDKEKEGAGNASHCC